MQKGIKYLLPIFFILSMLSVQAQGGLLIFPKRVVFEGTKDRSATLNLSNTGSDTARYEISMVQIRMTEQGDFERINEPDSGQLFAAPYLRYFPRKVILGPNESQVVKLQLSNVDELGIGEYRSHLYFRSIPKSKPLGESEDSSQSTSLRIQLTPVYGITIPCIIRIGEENAAVQIADLQLVREDEQHLLSLKFNRYGAMSSYGDIAVTHISPKGKRREVAKIKGFAIYTPGQSRSAKIALNYDGMLSEGILSVVYTEAGQKDVIAEGKLSLN